MKGLTVHGRAKNSEPAASAFSAKPPSLFDRVLSNVNTVGAVINNYGAAYMIASRGVGLCVVSGLYLGRLVWLFCDCGSVCVMMPFISMQFN